MHGATHSCHSVNTSMTDQVFSSDSRPLLHMRVDDLDMGLVQRHISIGQERERYRGPLDPVAFLREQQCVRNRGAA